MSLEEQLEILIKKKHGNIKKFSESIGIPYGTINNIIKRGKLMNSGVGVVIEIFDSLNLDIMSIPTGIIKPQSEIQPSTLTPTEYSLLNIFQNLNREGQEKIYEYAKDLEASKRYIKADKFGMVQKEA